MLTYKYRQQLDGTEPFIYTFPGKGKMKMEWQVKKGSWKMGDHINCELQRNR